MPCSCHKSQDLSTTRSCQPWWKSMACVLPALALWVLIYRHLEGASHVLVETILGLSPGPLAQALTFFFYDTPKILLLVLLMVYVIAWLRAGLQLEHVRNSLSGKRRLVGYLLGAVFGAVTPFCSCSSIPLFLGFTAAHIPLGITMAFLVTSPLINEVAVVLLWNLLGGQFTSIYLAVGLGAGIIAGFFMDIIRAERWLAPFLQEAMQTKQEIPEINETRRLSFTQRHVFAVREVVTIFRRVWLWVILGVGLGAALHGYLPEQWFAEHLGDGQFWSVPLAVTLGIPLYTNVTGIVPVMESLLLKGLPAGTTLAFCMSTVAVSFPELLMLKQVMRWQLLAVFVGTLLLIFTLTGWLLNTVYVQL